MTPTPDTEAPVPSVPEVLASMDGQPMLPPEAPQPPVDNAHVAEGATPFSPEDIAANAGASDAAFDDLRHARMGQAPDADPLTSTSAGAEPFTNADGTPGPIVTEALASGADLAVPSTPVLIASVALYREPDGSFSIVREHAPQTFHKTVGELVHQATEYVEQRLKHVGL